MNTTTYTPNAETLAALQSGDIESLTAIKRSQFGGYLMEDGAGDGAGDAGGGDTDGAGDGDNSADGDGNEDDTNKAEEDARVKRANSQAAASRVALREAQTQLEEQGKTLAALAAVFNPNGDKDADPAALAAQATAEAEALKAQVAQAKAELHVHTVAGALNANPVALLDSRSFTDVLHGLDPTADDYSTQVADAIKGAVAKNSAYSAAGQGSSSGGGELDAQQRETQKGKRAEGLGAAIGAVYAK